MPYATKHWFKLSANKIIQVQRLMHKNHASNVRNNSEDLFGEDDESDEIGLSIHTGPTETSPLEGGAEFKKLPDIEQKSTMSATTPFGAQHNATYPGTNTFHELTKKLTNVNLNRVLWNDNYDVRIIDRDAIGIQKNIDATVEEFGGLDSYMEMTGGIDPYSTTEPVCGLSANNIFKLMVEDEASVNPMELSSTDYSQFSSVLSNLDHEKNHLFYIKDTRLGHNYLIDVPAGPEIKAHIIQSDLGDGAMPPLKFGDWLKSRCMDSINERDILAFMQPGFARLDAGEKRRLLATIFGIDRNPAVVNLPKLHEDKGASFVMHSYERASFDRNVAQLLHSNASE